MMAYAARTGTRRNLAALRAADWGLFVSAAGVWRDEGFGDVAGDNGAWTDHQRGLPFDEERFARFVDWFDSRPKFLVLPDIVMGGAASLALSLRWLPRLARHPAKLLIAVQNGMEPAEIAPHLSPRVGVAVGGDTEWKVATLARWASLAHRHDAHCHVLRVNTRKRVRLCAAAGADSFDGSSASRFAVTLPPLDMARRQTDLEGFLARQQRGSRRTPSSGRAPECAPLTDLDAPTASPAGVSAPEGRSSNPALAAAKPEHARD